MDSLKDRLNKEYYTLTDLDYFNWKLSHLAKLDVDENAEEPSILMFSTEFKENIGYRNFSIDIRMGDDFPLYTERGGAGIFTYDDTIYYAAPTPVLTSYNHLFYIDNNATNIEAAVKERLESNFNHKFTVENTQITVQNFLYDIFYQEYNPEDQWYLGQASNASDYARIQLNEIQNNADNPYHYLASYFNEYVYLIGFDFQSVMAMDFIIPVKDSTKITSPKFQSNDVNSDVSISTNAFIPLDTLISVAKLTSGEEYDKIVKVLNATNLDMFDLKLFSKSSGDYITALSDGTFEVKLPIKDELKGKDLMVYYVDEENKVKDYNVTITSDNKYAIFNTDHFSIYTLAEKNTNKKVEDNPNTYDGITNSVFLGFICLIGLAGAFSLRQR